MDNRSEKTISRAIFVHLLICPWFMSLSSPVSPASLIFASLTSPFVLKRILFSFPATSGWTIGQKTPLEGQSLIYHRIHPSFMSLSSPVTPSSFAILLRSALLSSRNKFILSGPPPEPRKVHRKLHWREALRKESLKSTFLFSIWTFSSKEQSLGSDSAAWFG